MSDLWITAASDTEADEATRMLTAARVEVAEYWPFLAAATTEDDYLSRKALVAERLAERIPDDALRQQVIASWDEDYTALHVHAQWDSDYDSDLYHDSRDPGVWYDKAIEDVEMGKRYSPPQYDQEAIWAYEDGWDDAEGGPRTASHRKQAGDEGRYSPVPGDPFRWIDPPQHSPAYRKFREVFPNGVPMRDEDLTDEQRAFLESGRAWSSRKQAARDVDYQEEEIGDGWVERIDVESAGVQYAKTEQGYGALVDASQGGWAWDVADDAGHILIRGNAATDWEARQEADNALGAYTATRKSAGRDPVQWSPFVNDSYRGRSSSTPDSDWVLVYPESGDEWGWSVVLSGSKADEGTEADMARAMRVAEEALWGHLTVATRKQASLEDYIEEVNVIVQDLTGLSVHDLPDYDFYNAYEDYVPPAEAARNLLREEGFLGSKESAIVQTDDGILTGAVKQCIFCHQTVYQIQDIKNFEVYWGALTETFPIDGKLNYRCYYERGHVANKEQRHRVASDDDDWQAEEKYWDLRADAEEAARADADFDAYADEDDDIDAEASKTAARVIYEGEWSEPWGGEGRRLTMHVDALGQGVGNIVVELTFDWDAEALASRWEVFAMPVGGLVASGHSPTPGAAMTAARNAAHAWVESLDADTYRSMSDKSVAVYAKTAEKVHIPFDVTPYAEGGGTYGGIVECPACGWRQEYTSNAPMVDAMNLHALDKDTNLFKCRNIEDARVLWGEG